MTKTFKISFTSDVWETIEVEANSKEEAQDKFDKGEYDLSNSIEMGKENLKVDLIEEI
jgi:hypothetical protein